VWRGGDPLPSGGLEGVNFWFCYPEMAYFGEF